MEEDESRNFQLEQHKIDQAVGFSAGAFGAGLAVLSLLERIGMPDQLSRLLVVVITLLSFIAAAGLRRTTQPVYFYAAGRILPTRYAGFAAAALVFGIFFGLLPLQAETGGFWGPILAFGFGLLVAFFGTGRLLRRKGAISLADLVAQRFPQLSVRLIVSVIIAVCACLVALAGYELATQGLMSAAGLNRSPAVLVTAALLCFLVVAGGLSTVVWMAIAALIVLLSNLVLPLGLGLVNGQPLPLPIIGDGALWSAANGRLAALTQSPAPHPAGISLGLAIALGFPCLAPLLGPVIASAREQRLARTGLRAFFWLALLAVLTCATLAAAALALDKGIVGHAPEALAPSLYAANAQGQISLCGSGAAGTATALMQECARLPGFAGALRSMEIRAKLDFLLLNLAALRQLGPVLAGLSDAVMVTLGLALAAAGVQSLMTSLGHDAVALQRRQLMSASLRLAVTRGIAVVTIAALGSLLSLDSSDSATALLLALFTAATFLTPLLVLLLWPPAASLDASITFLVSMILITGFVLLHGPFAAASDLAPFVLLAGLGGLIAGIISSLRRQEREEDEASGRNTQDMPPRASEETS